MRRKSLNWLCAQARQQKKVKAEVGEAADDVQPEENVIMEKLNQMIENKLIEARSELELILKAKFQEKFLEKVNTIIEAKFRRERLEMRRHESPDEIAPDDLAVIHAPDLFLRMEEIMINEAHRRFGATIIDTSLLSKDEVISNLALIFAGMGT